ncbi:hypothetical protein LR392_10430 [Arthrobacter sp. AK04]|uniref:hypothetical protein n=1 Tax=Arthrobacter sp. AK04 TaxID=2900048 RepID=UPI001E3CABF6|nr:hypothetical protein [Arthrobacter sp. AK04]MCD5342638.1 hypothetical protein [Arthrobacter sp. AK04]
MTQMATGRRGHQLKVSKLGAAKAAQQNDPLDNEYISGPAAAAPFSFAGAGMDAAPVAAGLAGTDASAGEDYVSAVWRTSSYLETVQWELDVAHESLVQAIKQAAGHGVDQAVLLQAANMTPDELATALVDTPPAFPAAI